MPLPSPETAIRRADSIVQNLNLAFQRGLNIAEVDTAEHENPQLHRDAFLVGLGLKPAASYLCPVTYSYFIEGKPNFNFSEITRTPDLNLQYDNSSEWCIWNPTQVARIIASHPQLFKQNSPNPFNEAEFTNYLEYVTGSRETTDNIAAGVLHGIPFQAAQDFALYYDVINSATNELWHNADMVGVKLDNFAPNVRQIGLNMNGEREEFLRLAQLFKFPNPELIAYTSLLRRGKVPGTGYIASGEVTIHETELTTLYLASEFEEKLQRVLAAN